MISHLTQKIIAALVITTGIVVALVGLPHVTNSPQTTTNTVQQSINIEIPELIAPRTETPSKGDIITVRDQSGKRVPPKTETTYVSGNESDFKNSCVNRGGIYEPARVEYGIGPIDVPPQCGFNHANDAQILCYSSDPNEEKTLVEKPCSDCTYRNWCGPAAGDFGPEHCRCGSYERLEVFSGEFTPAPQ